MINLVKYILRMLKNVNPSLSISSDGKSELNDILNKLYVYLVSNLKTVEDLSLLLEKDLHERSVETCNLNNIVKTIPNSVISKIVKYHNLETPLSLEFISCIGEYIMVYILEIAGDFTRSKRKTRMNSLYISQAIDQDNELKQLLNNVKFNF